MRIVDMFNNITFKILASGSNHKKIYNQNKIKMDHSNCFLSTRQVYWEKLTGRWRIALASSFFISYPSSGTCSILPLWANSRCVPGGRGWTSGRGVGPTGGGTPPWSMPTRDKHWKISNLVVVGKPTSDQLNNFFKPSIGHAYLVF